MDWWKTVAYPVPKLQRNHNLTLNHRNAWVVEKTLVSQRGNYIQFLYDPVLSRFCVLLDNTFYWISNLPLWYRVQITVSVLTRNNIIWIIARLLSVGLQGTNYCETGIIIPSFSSKNMYSEMMSVWLWPFCSRLSESSHWTSFSMINILCDSIIGGSDGYQICSSEFWLQAYWSKTDFICTRPLSLHG